MNPPPASRTLTDRLQALPAVELARLQERIRGDGCSGSTLVAAALWRCGIRRVLAVAGTPVDAVLSACVARGIRVIGCRHQQAAVLSASAANYLAGRLESAVVVSAGPAVTNTLTGLLVARDNGWPVLVLGGRRAVSEEGRGAFQELDALPLVSPLTRWASTPRRTCEIPDQILRAAAAAMSGRPGAAYLDLPEDVLAGIASPGDPAIPLPTPPPLPDPGLIEEAARWIRGSERPLLILGDGLRWSLDTRVLHTLVEQHGIPFITTSLARGYLPDSHALCAGEVRRSVQGEADVVVMAGAGFDWRFRFGAELAPGACVIHADADAAALGRNVRTAVSHAGDPGLFLKLLAEALAAPSLGEAIPPWSEWHERIRRACMENRPAPESGSQTGTHLLSPRQVVRAIRDVLPPEAIVTAEGNVGLAAIQRGLSLDQPLTWLDPGANGIIGASIPFALGARLACPDRPVVAVCGDTGFGISGMELETTVRHGLPVVVVIFNNDGNSGALRQEAWFPPDHPEQITSYLPGLHYERLVEIFGGHAESVSEDAGLRGALRRALNSGRTACVSVRVDPHAAHAGIW
ncbi:MAG: thiamine pyrophosphate-binding protein [Verrucomicrobia bacterium]|nr:thiamine pyrophosphate-binding protein [Verrucomicrobiota bacterium]